MPWTMPSSSRPTPRARWNIRSLSATIAVLSMAPWWTTDGPVRTVGPVLEPTVRPSVEPRHGRGDPQAHVLEQARVTHDAEERDRVLGAVEPPERRHVGVPDALRHGELVGQVGVHDLGTDDRAAEQRTCGLDEPAVVEEGLDAPDQRLVVRPVPAEQRRHRHLHGRVVPAEGLVLGRVGEVPLGGQVRGVVLDQPTNEVAVVEHLRDLHGRTGCGGGHGGLPLCARRSMGRDTHHITRRGIHPIDLQDP